MKVQNDSVCALSTSPCVPSTRLDVEIMWTFCRRTRRRFECTHGSVLNLHTSVFQRATPHTTHTLLPHTAHHTLHTTHPSHTTTHCRQHTTHCTTAHTLHTPHTARHTHTKLATRDELYTQLLAQANPESGPGAALSINCRPRKNSTLQCLN